MKLFHSLPNEISSYVQNFTACPSLFLAMKLFHSLPSVFLAYEISANAGKTLFLAVVKISQSAQRIFWP